MWWWLSFCDTEKPEGQQFLGACFVRGTNMIAAVKNAHMFDINPGGEVQGVEVPSDLIVPEWAKNKLLTKANVERLDAEWAKPKTENPSLEV